MDLLERVNDLIWRSDPDGPSHERLVKIRDAIQRGSMIGPGHRRFVHELVQGLDNIECESLELDGICRVRRMRTCPYTEHFSACELYSPAREQLRGDPVAIGEEQ